MGKAFPLELENFWNFKPKRVAKWKADRLYKAPEDKWESSGTSPYIQNDLLALFVFLTLVNPPSHRLNYPL